MTAADEHLPTRHADVALVAAALDAFDLLAAAERTAFLGWAERGRPQADTAIGRTVELRHGGRSHEVEVRQLGPDHFAVRAGGADVVARVERLGRKRTRLVIGDETHAVVSSDQGTEHLVEVDGVAHRFSRDDAGIVRAPAAALVVGVDVAPGDVVAAGDRLGVVEAMKMEIGVPAPIGGRVRDVFVARNVQVAAGAALFRIEPEGDADADSAGAAIALDHLVSVAPDPAATLAAFLLGYDVDTGAARAALAAGGGHAALLDVFADLAAVAPERRDPAADDGERAPREHLYSYLRSLDLDREGLPTWFGEALTRAVGHYRVTSLDPSPQLEAALLRIFVSEQRRDEQVPVVLALLDEVAGHADAEDHALRETLDRLIERTRRRYPEVAAQARTVRYRLFDRPHVERSRAVTSARMRALASALAGPDPDPELVQELVARPLPLMPILAEDGVFAATPTPGGLVEVLVRRYYKIRELAPVVHGADGVLRTSYERHERVVHVLANRVEGADLDAALAAIASGRVDGRRAGHGRRRRLPHPSRRLTGRRRRAVGAPGHRARRRRAARARAPRDARRLAPRRRHARADVPPARRRPGSGRSGWARATAPSTRPASRRT